MEDRPTETGSTGSGLPTAQHPAPGQQPAQPPRPPVFGGPAAGQAGPTPGSGPGRSSAIPGPGESAAHDVVAALVESGIIAPEEATRAVDVIAGRLGAPALVTSGPRVAAEIAGYVGGILVLAAGAVFVAASWKDMGLATRCISLLAGALILAIAAALTRTVLSNHATAADRAVRRRLAGVFGIGAAALVAGTVGTWLDAQIEPVSEHYEVVPFAAYATFAVFAVAAYLFAPTVPGQAAIGFGTVVATFSGSGLVLDRPELLHSVALLALGLAWLALAEARRWHEVETGRVVGGTITLIGAQSAAFGSEHRGVAYLLLAVAGVTAFTGYARFRAWPYLAVGVIGLTLAATEAAVDYIDSEVGAAAGLLMAGAMLLATSLFAMRLRQRSRPA